MAKPEWGTKRICQACGKKFYDLKNSPIICPYCGVEYDPQDYLRTKKGKNISSKTSVENDNDLADNIDDIEVGTDNEVVSDDDPLLEINKEDQNVIADGVIDMDEDISFIDDDEITEDDNSINVDINEDDKN